MKHVVATLATLMMVLAVSASIAAPLSDPGKRLSPKATAQVRDAAAAFETLTSRRMAIVVLPIGAVPDRDKLYPMAGADSATGIIYALSPDDPAGRLFIVDPVWRDALPREWETMFPQRLAQLYGTEPFEARVVLSARYLSQVFADKVAFVLKPRGGKLNEGSLQFSRSAFIGIEILGYFIILFTVFRTLFPARLKDEDQDDFSNELRRLKKQRQIW